MSSSEAVPVEAEPRRPPLSLLIRSRREFTVEPVDEETVHPFWDTPVDAEADRARSRARRRLGTIAAVAGVVLIAGAIAGALISRARGSAPVKAVFNAPMMIWRAAEAGRVLSIAVKPGQRVEPATVMLTMQTAGRPNPAEVAARNRVLVAQRRLAAYDSAVSQPVSAGEASRLNLVELFRARDAAAAELAAAQDVVANLTGANIAVTPVKAGIHGVIWSVEIPAGTEVPLGAALVRMADCDHAFFTITPGSSLRAGQSVEILLPDTPPLQATVRSSSGVAEPPDALVVEPETGALADTCPIGATAEIGPAKVSS